MQSRGRSQPRVRRMASLVAVASSALAAATLLSLFVPPVVAPAAAAASGSPSVPSDVPRAVVTNPVTGGSGIDLPGTTSFDLRAVGYEQSEYFLSGRADAYASAGPLASSGRWKVTMASAAPYKTRIVVYRPIDPRRFDGTVVVEWLNVSGGVDAAAAWLTDHVQMIRSGMAYVGVSAQVTGVDDVEGRGSGAIRLPAAPRGQLLVQHLPAGRCRHSTQCGHHSPWPSPRARARAR